MRSATCALELSSVLNSILAFAMVVASTSGQGRKPQGSCRGVEATLRVDPTTFERGTHPTFAVVLKNVSKKPVRLIDVREGRRPDLAHAYYEIVVERNGQVVKDLPRAISDPGPVDTADFFELSPGTTVKAPITTSTDLSALQGGQYSAHVRITLDPFSESKPSCRSAPVSFNVRE